MEAIETMELQHKVNHIKEVLNFAERHVDDFWVEQVLVDAGYVIDQLWLEIVKKGKSDK